MDEQDPRNDGDSSPDRELTPGEFRRVKELFREVSQLRPDEAEKLLDSRIDVEPQVVSEVRDLMAPATIDASELPGMSQASSGAGAPSGPLLTEGQTLGRYRIRGRLGSGGMGEVFAAEELEGHRQVALKVINPAMAHGVSRDRFLREGKLAASINHPNSVYVFGTEEADGVLFIAMELMPGGTLADVVKQRGPLPYAEAVDAALQMIAGLRAAEARGVLHRDIKPANCFVDADQTIKVGDYGLSKPTDDAEATVMTQVGTVMGTPSFAPPEQLKSEKVDVRSDIYAVGATLFYLITGKIPFAGTNSVQVISAVLSDPPDGVDALAKAAPANLQKVILRCMAKSPEARPQSYDELEERLRPYSSETPPPAPAGLRVAAAVVDSVIFAMLGLTAVLGIAEIGQRLQGRPPLPDDVARFMPLLLSVLYFGLIEGLLGAGPGKGLLGLRAVRDNGRRIGVPRALARSALFHVPTSILTLVVWLILRDDTPSGGAFALITLSGMLVPFVLFIGAGPRSGWVGIHDRWSGSRVTPARRRPEKAAPPLDLPAPKLRPLDQETGAGGFPVTGELTLVPGATVQVATDRLLDRPLWIRPVDAAHPTPPDRRQLSRAARLRWVAGAGDWEAYEAVDGAPVMALTQPLDWGTIQPWLLTAAEELSQETAPALVTPDQLWVTADRRLKWVDAELLGLTVEDDSTDRWAQAQQVLYQAFAHLLAPGQTAADGLPAAPIPLHVRHLLSRLKAGRVASPVALLTEPAVCGGADTTLRKRRFVSAALQVAPSVAFSSFMALAFILLTTLPIYLKNELELQGSLKRLAQIEAADYVCDLGPDGRMVFEDKDSNDETPAGASTDEATDEATDETPAGGGPNVDAATGDARPSMSPEDAGLVPGDTSTDPVPTDPVPTDPIPTDTASTDTASTDTVPTDTVPTDTAVDGAGDPCPGLDREREALEVQIGRGLERRLAMMTRWTRDPKIDSVREAAIKQLPADQRTGARRAAERYPNPTDEQVARAQEQLEPLLSRISTGAERFRELTWSDYGGILAVLSAVPLIFVGLVSLVSAPLMRGGVTMRLLGLGVVRPDGTAASRLRCLGRAAIAWSAPLLVAPFLMDIVDLFSGDGKITLSAIVIGIMTIGGVRLLRRPDRGFQDQLAGTVVVRR